jgi:hypothetical protein
MLVRLSIIGAVAAFLMVPVSKEWGHRQRLRLSGYPDCGGP